jgi:hypothetical protein
VCRLRTGNGLVWFGCRIFRHSSCTGTRHRSAPGARRRWPAPPRSASPTGGWLFARRYQHTRSLLTVSVEHALEGVLIFTVGARTSVLSRRHGLRDG